MTFLSGIALWLLGLGAIITFIYFLKRQARVQPVSTLFLWQRIEQRPQSALRFQWTQLLGLILQLLALTAIVVGIAQPVIYSASGGVGRMAILLDGSASMRALMPSEKITRFERAVQRAQGLLDENPAAEVTLVEAQTHSAILVPPTHDHSFIRKALSDARPTYQGNADSGELLSLLQSQSSTGYDQVVLISDQAAKPQQQQLGIDVESVLGDESSENIALTDFSVREQPNGKGYDFYLQAWNSSSDAVNVPLDIEADGKSVQSDVITIPAHGSLSRTFSSSLRYADEFRAKIDTTALPDDWSDDDVRYATSPQPPPWKILWVGKINFYLESFLQNSGEVDLTEKATLDEAGDLNRYDVVLLNQVDLSDAQAGAGHYLAFGGSFGSYILSKSIHDLTSGAVDVQKDDPLLQGMDPTAWRLLHIPDAAVDPKGEVLLSSESLPFLYIYEKPGLRLSYIGADLEASNLVLSIDFPILIYRLLSWLSPRSGESTTLTAGDELPLSSLENIKSIVDPQGKTCQYNSSASQCGSLGEIGFYQATRADGEAVTFAANADPTESIWEDASDAAATAVTPTSSQQAGSLGDTPQALKAAIPVWPYLLAIGLILLLAELFTFHRPTAIPWLPSLGRKRA
ncbi:BatA domain-containing protein [Candidatus Acetothermia bacterium]|nr:BatA domain-containing protein [Candidatus Acetothermia bacterium]MBI3643280.1 BatA domain-containing protein [Candidatus Acetothermia bacterium]